MIENVFRQMSPEEIYIETIRDIKMIHIYDLTGAAGPDGKFGITAVLVNYGDNEQQNFTENDYCFNAFIKKIFEAYNTAFDKDKIIMDETTRQIMEAGEVPRHDSILGRYYEAEKQDSPVLVYASTLSRRFEPLIEYLITGLYKTMGTEVDVIDRKTGWRGSGRLIIRVGDTNRTIYFKIFEVNDSTFSIKLNGFMDDAGDLLINVILYDDTITFLYRSVSAGLDGSSSFKFGKDCLREMHQIKKNGEQLFYDVNTYENSFTEESKIEDILSSLSMEMLPEGIRPCAVYSLPIGLDYLLYDKTETTDAVEVQTFCGAFIWQDAAAADIRGWSVIKSLASGLALKNESFRIIKMSDKRLYIESSFLPGTGSRYKEELEGKFVLSERKSV